MRTFSACIAMLAYAALTGCGSAAPPSAPVDWVRCVSVSGAHPADLALPPDLNRTLLIDVAERGLSVLAAADGGAWSASPIARIGTITLLAKPSQTRTAHRLSIQSHDSRDISAQVCVTVRPAPAAGSVEFEAAQALQDAGTQSARLDWAQSYQRLSLAARVLDMSGLRSRADQARLAMTAIAYWHLEQKPLAEAVASGVLSRDRGQLDPTARSQLIELIAMARMDAPDADPRENLRALLPLFDRAEVLGRGTLYGTREAPRLDNLRGFLYYNADDLPRATALLERAAQRCLALMDWECHARARQNHVLSAEGTQDYAAALEEYRSALEHLDPALEPHLAADISENLGGLQGLLALTRESQRSYLSAIRLYASSTDCDGLRRSLSRFGSMLVDTGSPGDARELLRAASARSCSALIGRIGNSATTAQLSDALAAAHGASDPGSSEPCANPQNAANLSDEGRYAVFVALLYLGNTASQSGAMPAADRCFAEARRYVTDTHAQLRYDEGFAAHLARYGASADAERLYRHMVATADEARLPSLHVKRSAAALGLVRAELDQGRARDALARLSVAVGPIGQRGDAGQLIQALRLHAAIMRAGRDDRAAAASLRGATSFVEAVPIAALEGEQRASFVATQHDVYAEWTDLAAGQALAHPELAWEAFAVSERGRARSLRLALSQSPEGIAKPAAAEDAAYHHLLDAVREDARTPEFSHSWPAPLLHEISNAESDEAPASAVQARTSHTLASLKASLVEYAAGDERLFAFVADGRAIRVIALGPIAPVRERAGRLLAVLRNPEATRRSVEPAARELAQLIWWPIVGALTEPRVVIVADDSLNTVPFAVLPWSPENAELSLAHAELSFASSASLLSSSLAEEAGTDSAHHAFALFGDPVTSAAAWSRECTGAPGIVRAAQVSSAAALPGSRREVSEAASIVHRAEPHAAVDLHLGCTVTRHAMEQTIAADPLLLHIATHGSIDANRPRLSAMLLSDTGPGDTDFSVADILKRHITTRLVVLSACETSAGRLLPGEGVLGPAQAFLQAGARAVVGSGWRVPDERTARLMTRFYSLLFDSGLPASSALRAAQLEEASTTPSYAWAAFGVYGSPDVRFTRINN